MQSFKKVWSLTDKNIEKVNSLKDIGKLKHGMFSAIPIICKGDKCPYKATCSIDSPIQGERCVIEISAIVTRFDMWCNHFEIENENENINEEDLVDATLIRDLIDIEIQIARAENRLAAAGDFIVESVCNSDNKGNVFYEEKVGPESEYKMTLLDKRYKIMQLLNSTRKDKIKKEKGSTSNETLSIIKEVKGMLKDVNLDDI